MHDIPRERVPDSTLALLRDPYRFIGKRCDHYGTDLFEARLLLRKTICMRGEQAARLFYDSRYFTRAGAAPEPLRATLFGNGGVQTLEGERHLSRKSLFLGILTPAAVDRLVRLTETDLGTAALAWADAGGRVTLYDEARHLLSRAVCEWAGISLAETEIKRRTAQLTALFQHAGSVGVPHLWARTSRYQAEQWAADQILSERQRASAVSDTPLQQIATWRESNGELLPLKVAAVELLNILRPTVAVAVFITHAAVALHSNPDCRRRIAAGDDRYTRLFVQEVRRFYPFFPAMIANVREDFEWDGFRFERSQRVLLDLYGTNHDSRSWPEPEAFRPERFLADPGPYAFIPQGGGETDRTHRCPGEALAIELMMLASRFLARDIQYEVPAQDLSLNMRELPSLPRSRFEMENVQLMR